MKDFEFEGAYPQDVPDDGDQAVSGPDGGSLDTSSRARELVTKHEDEISIDLSRLLVARYPIGEKVDIARLGVVQDPHTIVALEDGRYTTGSPVAFHNDIAMQWEEERRAKGTFTVFDRTVSGYGFRMKPDPEAGLVARLDRPVPVADETPVYASGLIRDGYTVFDTLYRYLPPQKRST